MREGKATGIGMNPFIRIGDDYIFVDHIAAIQYLHPGTRGLVESLRDGCTIVFSGGATLHYSKAAFDELKVLLQEHN